MRRALRSALRQLDLIGKLHSEPTSDEGVDSAIAAVRATLSWRVTRPIRVVRTAHAELAAIRRDRSGADSGARIIALRRRLDTVVQHLTGSNHVESDEATGALLDRLVVVALDDPSPAPFWLLLVAISGTMPTVDDLLAARRAGRASAAGRSGDAVLGEAVRMMNRDHSHYRSLSVISDSLVMFVDRAAKIGTPSVPNRIVRSLARRWSEEPDTELVAWDAAGHAARRLTDDEAQRVLEWSPSMRDDDTNDAPLIPPPLAVPWRCDVVLPEVSAHRVARRLECLAQFGGGQVSVIGHETLPAIRGFLVPDEDGDAFAAHLSVIKHADLICCDSDATRLEFEGFIEALGAQGLAGPATCVVTSPQGEDLRPIEREPTTADPLVLVLGRLEPRSNHLAVLDSAERLWNEGVRFTLVIAGERGWSDWPDLAERTVDLVLRGRPVLVVDDPTPDSMARLISRARFQVYVPLHDPTAGFLAYDGMRGGLPTVIADRGPGIDLAAGGGCVGVDTLEPESIADAMRSLLERDDIIADLRSEVEARSYTSMDDYARNLLQVVHGSARSFS